MDHPEAMVAFAISEERARELVREWAAKEVLAPNDFRYDPPIDQMSAVYAPFWAFGAKVRSSWSAEVGYYADTDWVRKKRYERRIDWGSTATGDVEHIFDGVLVPAATSFSPHLGEIEPWPVDQLQLIDNARVATPIEPVDVSRADAAQEARATMDRIMRNTCELATPGDTCRNLMVSSDYSAETARLVLAPVWRVRCPYGRKTFEVLVNGATGKLKGDAPTSVRKLATALLVVLAMLAVFYAIARARST